VVDKVLDGKVGGAEVRPHRNQARETNGFVLDGVGRGSVLAQLGLQPGDVIRSVNGLALGSMEAARDARRKVADADRLVLQVTRDGESLRLSYEIKRPKATT